MIILCLWQYAGKMPSILCLKDITKNSADGISNFLKSTFGKLQEGPLIYARHKGIAPSGLFKDIPGSKLIFLWKHKPGVIFGTGHPGELFYLLFRPKNSKYVINFHSVLYKGDNSPWVVRTPWWIRKFIFKRASLVICPSQFSANSVISLFPRLRVVSILNGVDLNLFSSKKSSRAFIFKKYKIPDDGVPLISFVGSLHNRKRPEVVAGIARAMPEARFVVLGRNVGEYDPSNFSKNRNIVWISGMPREDVAVLLSSSIAMLFPSLNDASAAVILEAMACGCVPVVSDSGGNCEFFMPNQSGLSAPVGRGELDIFYQEIKNLLKNSSFREKISKAAAEEAQKHSWQSVAGQYINAIEGI